MYKLLIVEDEKAIAHGIANSNPWEEWGFQVAGICHNGEEAVEFIKKDKPDLVLSDIRMPKMDGIGLMQYLNAEYPEIKIIILSGYNDFEYLQMSIRNHVAEYLLKPTMLDEFEELFRRMKDVLDKEARQRKEQKEQLWIRECDALLKGYGYSEEYVEGNFYRRDTDCYAVVQVHVGEDMEMGSKPLDKGWYYRRKQTVAKILNQGAVTDRVSGFFLCNYEECVTGILCMEEGIGREELDGYLEKLLEAVWKKKGIHLYCGVSRLYGDYRMFPQCYEQTKYCMGQKLLQGTQQRIFHYQPMEEDDFDYFGIAFSEESILKCILNQNREELEQELTETFSRFRSRFAKDYDYVNRICLEILFTVSRKIYRYNVYPEKLMNRHNYHYMDIYEKTALENKLDFLLDIFELYMQECGRQQGKYSKTGELARQVRRIVDEEYMSNLISLEYVAEKVHKNAAYISKVFKNEFDCNFSTYVTDRRLERSRELLGDPMVKVYEIAGELGWADVSNYIKVFKKKYGMSPDEYRKIAVARKGE